MTNKHKEEIEQISREFTKGLGMEIKGSGWMVVDPLSGYLNACGFKNKLINCHKKTNTLKYWL